MGQEDAKGYRRLLAWQKADQLAKAVFEMTAGRSRLPSWLAQQMARSAISVPANIAEGYTRGSLRDYLRFLDIARGSLAETEYFLDFAADTKLINKEQQATLSPMVVETGNLLFGLIQSLARKLAADTQQAHQRVREVEEAYDIQLAKPPSLSLDP